jgi:hypothetical protein
MALRQAKLGAAWWLPKIAAMVSVSSVAVLINVAHL